MIIGKIVVVDDRFAQNGSDSEARIAIDSVCPLTSSIKSIESLRVDNGAIHKTPVVVDTSEGLSNINTNNNDNNKNNNNSNNSKVN